MMADPGGARQLFYTSMAADAGAQSADRESARALRTSEWHQGLMHCAYWLKLFEVVRAFAVLSVRVMRSGNDGLRAGAWTKMTNKRYALCVFLT